VKNDSTTLDATWVDVTVNFWSGNVIVATEHSHLERIPAGQSLLVGFDSVYVTEAVNGISAFATCESEPLGVVRQVITGSATAFPSGLGDLEIRGQFTNTYPFALSWLARIDYVTRRSDGAINGGGYDYPSGNVPRGVTTGWQTWNPAFSDHDVPASIEFTVEPEAS
jgi:hypothetical protein